MITEKSRENRARRALAKLGLSLRKTPARSWLRTYYGPGYMVLSGGTVVSGCASREYSDRLEDVEALLAPLS